MICKHEIFNFQINFEIKDSLKIDVSQIIPNYFLASGSMNICYVKRLKMLPRSRRAGSKPSAQDI